jgi:hypothetical protein
VTETTILGFAAEKKGKYFSHELSAKLNDDSHVHPGPQSNIPGLEQLAWPH